MSKYPKDIWIIEDIGEQDSWYRRKDQWIGRYVTLFTQFSSFASNEGFIGGYARVHGEYSDICFVSIKLKKLGGQDGYMGD